MDPGGDELRLQIAIRYIQADHAALSQALVIRPRVCHLIPGLPALTQFARFILALYGIIQAGFIMLRFYTTRSIFAIPPSGTKPCGGTSRTRASMRSAANTGMASARWSRHRSP